ncbi:DUF29 domain-containing protein [Salmonella enterica]|nr:DUF29 domain-containing protein [Salmonella enterica]
MHANYETDFYAWTQEQAELLRAGKLTEIDAVSLLEEIESMGRSEKRELQSRLVKLFSHLLKCRYQPGLYSMSWHLTIKGQRIEIADCLADSPSLKSKLEPICAKAYELGRVEAAAETGFKLTTFPESSPWTFDEAMTVDYGPAE